MENSRHTDIIKALREEPIPLIITFKESQRKSRRLSQIQQSLTCLEEICEYSSASSYDSDEFEAHVARHILRRSRSSMRPHTKKRRHSSLLRSDEVHLWSAQHIEQETNAMLVRLTELKRSCGHNMSFSMSTSKLLSDFEDPDLSECRRLSSNGTVIMHSSSDSNDNDFECVSRLENGMRLVCVFEFCVFVDFGFCENKQLKHGKYGKPKSYKFFLDKAHSYFMWKSKKKSAKQTRIAVDDICEIVMGAHCEIVQKKVSNSLRSRSFTVFYGKRLSQTTKRIVLTADSKQEAFLCKRILQQVSHRNIV